MSRRPAVAVALHDVEPATFERCALLRDWLDDHGVDRVTLLVIPAPDLHHFDDRRPELVTWLDERRRAGDAVAQHGFVHRRLSAAAPGRGIVGRRHAGGAAEFVGLDPAETRQAVRAGLRVLRLAGIEPRGFVAPAYAYTPALVSTLETSFDWWASRGHVHWADRPSARAPAVGVGAPTLAARCAAPILMRLGALAGGPLLRVDVHPGDVGHPHCIRALETVLRRSRGRTAVTYDELADILAAPPAVRHAARRGMMPYLRARSRPGLHPLFTCMPRLGTTLQQAHDELSRDVRPR